MLNGSTELAHARIIELRREADARRSRRPAGRTGRFGRLLGLVAIVVVLAACGGTEPAAESPISEQQAIDIAENAMSGFNSGDYTTWSRDWSAAMVGAIDEQAFLGFRDQYHEALGDFVSIEQVTGEPGNDPGVYRWTFDMRFEKGEYGMYLAFKGESPKVEGIEFLEPADA